jgi:hypothetical protein
MKEDAGALHIVPILFVLVLAFIIFSFAIYFNGIYAHNIMSGLDESDSDQLHSKQNLSRDVNETDLVINMIMPSGAVFLVIGVIIAAVVLFMKKS